jgi:hypothetical protein
MTSEHPVTYGDAADLPFADVLNRYQALDSRDAMARSIATLQARGDWYDDRSIDPADYPPLSLAEHLELIALGEVIARRYRHPANIHDAVMSGATWAQIAAAAGGDPDQARHAYLAWAVEQRELRQQFLGGTIGLGDGEYAAAVKAASEPVPGPSAGGGTAVAVLRSAADALAADLATWEARDPATPGPEARRARRSAIATADAVTGAMSRLLARLEGGRP